MIPSDTNRQMLIGYLSELKDAERKLRIQMDTVWKQHQHTGEPMDYDMKYVERLDPVRLRVQIDDIEKKWYELQGVLKEIEHTEAKLGIQGGSH